MRVILCVCVWEREHCIWYSVHFRLLNLSNNCKVLGQLSSAFSFSCSLVSFRFVSLFIYSFRLPQSHVSRLLLLLFLLFQMQLEKLPPFGDQNAIKEEINRRAMKLSLLQMALTRFFALLTNTRQTIR